MLGILTDPIVQTGALAAIGTLITRFLLRDHPRQRLVGQLIFFAALTTLLLHYGIVPFKQGPDESETLQRAFIDVAKIIWWTNAAWSLIGIVRVFLIFERRPREVRLLQDLIVGVIYVGAVLSIIAYVFDAPVGTLIATSGAIAIVLGLALQSTLGDVFSGIALNLARPYGIGDWLVLNNGIEGEVVETNWRATHLLNGTNDLVAVPNSDLAKARLTNLSSPEKMRRVTVEVQLRPTTTPSTMAHVMRLVLASSNTILPDPLPSVHVTSLDASATRLELSFAVTDNGAVAATKSEIFDLIYRHAKASGLVLAPPSESAGVPIGQPADELIFGHHITPRRLLDAITLFASLTGEEKDMLAKTMVRRTFRKNDILVERGAVLTSLMIIRSGIVTITGETLRGIRLAPGDFFGEAGLLTGAAEFGVVEALTSVVVYEVTQEGLAPLLKERPMIADDLGALLSKRTAAEHARRELLDAGQTKTAPRLTARIRQLFGL